MAFDEFADFSKPDILIDAAGNARVCDFGHASIAQGEYSTSSKSDQGHTPRWTAPEILFGKCITSKSADIFAFGMVVVEVCAPSKGDHGATDRVLTQAGLALFIGVHGEGTFPQPRLQHGELEAHEWRPPAPTLRGPRIWPDGFYLEDGRMLLDTASQGPSEGVRSGLPSARDVRFHTDQFCGCHITLFL